MAGRYTASNIGILKTVFEVNLQLSAKSHEAHSKTILMFVVRDHIEQQTPLAAIELQACMPCIGFDWIGLDSNWIGFDCDWIGLDWI